jgi:hypothetical protein
MQPTSWKTYLLQASLFLLTILTTTYAGAVWTGIERSTLEEELLQGLLYSIPFLTILTIHEFGHYIAAKLYKIAVTLPYYIPIVFPGPLPGIGTFGAFIRIKGLLRSRTMVVGAAGPLAGFFAALCLIVYGFTHLPAPEYVYQVHKEYAQFGKEYSKHVYTYDYLRLEDSLRAVKYHIAFVPQEQYEVLSMGTNLLFKICEKVLVTDPSYIPNKYEMFHYPFLFAGFLALFFTAINLIPIGQLDGGHILYALIGGEKQRLIAPVLFGLFVFLGCLDFMKESFGYHPMDSFEDMMRFAPFYLLFLYMVFSRVYQHLLNNLLLAVGVFALQFFALLLFPQIHGFGGWGLLFIVILGRFLGIYHPPAMDDTPIDLKRKIIGWFSLVIFILCFSPEPLIFEFFHK